jgi:hypothetical protein
MQSDKLDALHVEVYDSNHDRVDFQLISKGGPLALVLSGRSVIVAEVGPHFLTDMSCGDKFLTRPYAIKRIPKGSISRLARTYDVSKTSANLLGAETEGRILTIVKFLICG